jgi:hypothetical protein
MSDIPVVPDVVVTLVGEYVSVRSLRDDAAGRLKEIQAAILEAWPELGTFKAGEHKLIISTRATLDEALVEAEWPPGEFPDLYALKLDTKEVRNQVAPKDLEPFTNISAPTVSVR